MEERSLKIEDNRDKLNCKFCNKDMTNAIQCHGAENTSWKYLNDKEHSHFECYVDECVKHCLDKLKE